jgi:acyl-coenzyme A synthetase/AMP-(fatty) acid ligase
MVVFFGTPELLQRTTQLLGPIWAHGFGSTEQGAVTTRLLAREVAEKPERISSVGRVGSPFLEVAVVDDDGARLPAGEVGEIVVRSAMSIGAYWEMPDKTSTSFFPGDWFRPFDVGYLDEDGFLYYADRAGDKIVTSRGVVFPHLVEAAILRHAAAANCGVFGHGPEGNQVVVAAVQLKAGFAASPELEAEFFTDAAEGLSEHERPSHVVFVSELPTVLGGAKVQRQALREQLQGRLRERVSV